MVSTDSATFATVGSAFAIPLRSDLTTPFFGEPEAISSLSALNASTASWLSFCSMISPSCRIVAAASGSPCPLSCSNDRLTSDRLTMVELEMLLKVSPTRKSPGALDDRDNSLIAQGHKVVTRHTGPRLFGRELVRRRRTVRADRHGDAQRPFDRLGRIRAGLGVPGAGGEEPGGQPFLAGQVRGGRDAVPDVVRRADERRGRVEVGDRELVRAAAHLQRVAQ